MTSPDPTSLLVAAWFLVGFPVCGLLFVRASAHEWDDITAEVDHDQP